MAAEMPPPRAAIYVRTATQGQMPADDPLTRQERACRAYAAAQGYTVEDRDVYRDVAAGLALEGRPGLDALRAAVRGGAVTCVVAETPDRLSRDPQQVTRLVREVEQAGAHVGYATPGVWAFRSLMS